MWTTQRPRKTYKKLSWAFLYFRSYFRSIIDQYFGLQFDTETKCVESEDEAPTKAVEHFLQFNCYIDKDVKYLMSGLKNVR